MKYDIRNFLKLFSCHLLLMSFWLSSYRPVHSFSQTVSHPLYRLPVVFLSPFVSRVAMNFVWRDAACGVVSFGVSFSSFILFCCGTKCMGKNFLWRDCHKSTDSMCCYCCCCCSFLRLFTIMYVCLFFWAFVRNCMRSYVASVVFNLNCHQLFGFYEKLPWTTVNTHGIG